MAEQPSLTPHRDEAERMIRAAAERTATERAGNTYKSINSRIANAVTDAMLRAMADEMDAGTGRSEIYQGCICGLRNAAGSVGFAFIAGDAPLQEKAATVLFNAVQQCVVLDGHADKTVFGSVPAAARGGRA